MGVRQLNNEYGNKHQIKRQRPFDVANTTHLEQYAMASAFVDALHNKAHAGYVCVTQLVDGNPSYTRYIPAQDLPRIPTEFVGADDVYVSLHPYRKMSRATEQLLYCNALYVDLDYYKSAKYKGKRVNAVLKDLTEIYENGTLLKPTLTVQSGRGIQLIWLLDAPLFFNNDSHMDIFYGHKQLVLSTLKDFGADSKACSRSQVYRLPGSRHSKSRKVVTYEETSGSYTADELTSFYADYYAERKKAKENRIQRKRDRQAAKVLNIDGSIHKPKVSPPKANNKTVATLAKGRMDDIRKVIRHKNRYEDRESLHRKQTIYVVAHIAYYLSLGNYERLYKTVCEINDMFYEPLDLAIVQATTKHAHKKCMSKDMQYRFSNNFILDALEITAEEMRELNLSVLVNRQVKNERKRVVYRKARDAAGLKSRDAQVDTKLNLIKALIDEREGYITKEEIVNEVGCTLRNLNQYIKKYELVLRTKKEIQQRAVSQMLAENPYLTISEATEKLKLSRQTVSKIFKLLNS